jgi:hypothetical protein
LRKPLIVVAALLVVLVAAVAAAASIPDAQGVIHACRDRKSGALRVIDTEAGQSCSSREAALTWNQTGPAGPAGPAGSIAGAYVVTSPEYVADKTLHTLSCKSGGTALSISFESTTVGQLSGDQWVPSQARPLVDATGRPTGYEFSTNGFNYRAHVTCAS